MVKVRGMVAKKNKGYQQKYEDHLQKVEAHVEKNSPYLGIKLFMRIFCTLDKLFSRAKVRAAFAKMSKTITWPCCDNGR